MGICVSKASGATIASSTAKASANDAHRARYSQERQSIHDAAWSREAPGSPSKGAYRSILANPFSICSLVGHAICAGNTATSWGLSAGIDQSLPPRTQCAMNQKRWETDRREAASVANPPLRTSEGPTNSRSDTWLRCSGRTPRHSYVGPAESAGRVQGRWFLLWNASAVSEVPWQISLGAPLGSWTGSSFRGYSDVVGSITDRTREIRLAGKPPNSACLRTESSSGAT